MLSLPIVSKGSNNPLVPTLASLLMRTVEFFGQSELANFNVIMHFQRIHAYNKGSMSQIGS